MHNRLMIREREMMYKVLAFNLTIFRVLCILGCFTFAFEILRATSFFLIERVEKILVVNTNLNLWCTEIWLKQSQKDFSKKGFISIKKQKY